MENIENMEPNCPELAQLIRENLTYRHQQSIKQTLFKESLMKISLEKDFSHIFNHQSPSKSQNQPVVLLEVPQQIKTICSWLEESQTFGGEAYIKTSILPKLAHVLHQKVQTLAIVVTEYQTWWMGKMQKLDRLSTLKWGFFNPMMSNQQKVKVLQLYQLKKLKLLFISPSLFKNQQYHQFECDLLVVCDLHLYTKSPLDKMLSQIVKKTSPGRVLGLHSTLTHQIYQSFNEKLETICNPQYSQLNFIALKTPASQKCKTIVAYINRHNFHNILVIGTRKAQLSELSKKLQMESLTVFNLCDGQGFSSSEFHSFNVPDILYKPDKKQEKALDLIKKATTHNITLSLYCDPLRFGEFDAVVFYGFLEVNKFVNYCPQVKNKLILLVDEDYFALRNCMTSDLLPSNYLHKIAVKLMEKPQKREENGLKRCYSQHVDDKILDCFSTNKETQEKHEEKVIKINGFCKQFDLSPRIFSRLIDVLVSRKIIEVFCKVPYQIQVEEESLQTFRKLHPRATQLRRKVNLLGLSTCLHKTTSDILGEMRGKDLKYKITEETIQIVLLKDFQEVQWIEVCKQLNKVVEIATENMDRSYDTFRDCAYGSMELTRREKFLNRKDRFIAFAAGQSNLEIEPVGGMLESAHRSNLLSAEIQEWLKNSEQRLDEHELILMLQGVDKPKFSHLKKDLVFGRYKRFKYQEMSEAMNRIAKNKRIKL